MSSSLVYVLLLSYFSICSAFLNSCKSTLQLSTRCTRQKIVLSANKQNNNADDSSNESPFFFASVSSDNSTSTVGAVGAAAAVGGAMALTETGGITTSIAATSTATTGAASSTSTTAVLSGGRIAASGGSIAAARSAAIGGTAASGIASATSSSSTATVSAAGSTAAGRSVASGATALGTIASSRAKLGGAGIVASEIGSSSLEGTGIGSAILTDGSSSAITTALSGTEDLLVGDAATDAVLSVASDGVAGVGEVADTLLVAAGEAGAGALSFVPSWLLSGGLAALASELAFGVFALFIVLQAGGNAAGDIVRNSVSKDAGSSLKNEEIVKDTFHITEQEDISTQDMETSTESKLAEDGEIIEEVL